MEVLLMTDPVLLEGKRPRHQLLVHEGCLKFIRRRISLCAEADHGASVSDDSMTQM